jgi:3-dehydroquinate dehydratase-2
MHGLVSVRFNFAFRFSFFTFYFCYMKIAMINGPNLNLLCTREVDVYGNQPFETYFEELKKQFPQVEFEYYQSNVEGELITKIQQVGFSYNGIVFNPGGYTHTSVAIGDAIAAIKTPVIEVHISNIFGREDFRKISHVSAKSVGVISGLGLKGYALAVSYLVG